MPFFAIAPWEYPGADFDSNSHATSRLEIGGKKRTFWLKMREGIIFFRESTRIPVFAIPKLFCSDLEHDVDRLIYEWKCEVESDNYGAFIISHRNWPRTPVSANYCIIARANGSGWIKEHFDERWQEFSIPRNTQLALWNPKPAYGSESEKVVGEMRPHFWNRTVDAAHFQTIPAHWSGGGVTEMLEVLRSAALLWVNPDKSLHYFRRDFQWSCKSNSAFWAGSVSGDLTYDSSYRIQLIWDLVKWHYGFVGVEWKKVSDAPELQAKFAEQWQRGFDQWGENWRGNWVGRQYKTKFSMSPLSVPSHHEKLESVLTLREFLRDKMPSAKINDLLKDS
ncbi:hypothetical protein IAD21_01545 [Abditibacteriota bacterium]|nr:hypothetical protein IAD21_01545 [Abditibacteriota bacterium]